MKVLVSAYACEPHKGSEPGVGWNWVKQIARFHEVWVITRANNKEKIEEELNRNTFGKEDKEESIFTIVFGNWASSFLPKNYIKDTSLI